MKQSKTEWENARLIYDKLNDVEEAREKQYIKPQLWKTHGHVRKRSKMSSHWTLVFRVSCLRDGTLALERSNLQNMARANDRLCVAEQNHFSSENPLRQVLALLP
jgi:hypothetical protein